MTATGRPQLTAVIESVKAAKKAGGNVWADGGEGAIEAAKAVVRACDKAYA